MKTVLGCIRRADQDFSMFAPGDRVGVGVSGGKDSLLLLVALRRYQQFSKIPFELEALTLTMGMEPFDLSGVRALCNDLGIPYTVKETNIGKIIFEDRKEKNPCALCARMRRGALNNLAVERGLNKLALGHHREDVLSTLMLSLFYEGRLHTFHPVTPLSRCGITVIRPMVYVPQPHIVNMAKKLSLPIVPSPCPANGNTERATMEQLLVSLRKQFPYVEERMLGALRNTSQYRLWDTPTAKPE